MNRRALPVLVVLAVAVAGTVWAATTRDDEENASLPPATSATVAPTAAPASDGEAAPQPPPPSSGFVEVVIEQRNNPIFDLIPSQVNGVSVLAQFDEANENNLEEPLIIPAGKIRFVLENKGTLAHNFQVRLPDGTNLKKTKNVGPRRTGELIIDLDPGNYLIACPISDHDKRGMIRTLIVTAEQ